MKEEGEIRRELDTLRMWLSDIDSNAHLTPEENLRRQQRIDELNGAIVTLQWVLGHTSEIFLS